MEVHAHTHTPRKRWTHYFWEFLMLFLAVFCGFLAENKREHIVESHRAKDYAKGLYIDLQKDTAELKTGLHQSSFIVQCMDSLLSLSANSTYKAEVPGMFYYYSRFVSNKYRIDWAQSTINQLIQSGNLRYITNKDLVNKINDYYAQQGLISNQNETDLLSRNTIAEVRDKIFLNKYYRVFSELDINQEEYHHKPSRLVDSLMAVNLSIQPNGPMYIDEFLNSMNDRKWRLNLSIQTYYPRAIRTAEEIILRLKEEYKIKE